MPSLRVSAAAGSGSTDSGGGRPGECRMSTARGELMIRKERSSVALSIHCHRQSTLAG